MKAKYFKKLRNQSQYYYVCWRNWIFFPEESYIKILARNPEEAAKRFMKRRNDLMSFHGAQTNHSNGQLQVVPVKQNFERFKTYWI